MHRAPTGGAPSQTRITSRTPTTNSSTSSITALPPARTQSYSSRHVTTHSYPPTHLHEGENEKKERPRDDYGDAPHIFRRASHPEPHPHVEEELGWAARLHRTLPYAISHFLGHRTKPHVPAHPILGLFWTFVGIMCAIILIAVVAEHIPMFFDNGAPVIVASFGAAAVLEFQAIESPFAQPRNVVCSQIIASVLGVGISKLFALSSNHMGLRFVGGALACALATVLMAITGTVHPPAGATALIAVVDERTIELGWRFVPLVLLSSVFMFLIALLVNNIQKRYPVYWWSPKKEAKRALKKEESNFSAASTIEAGHQVPSVSRSSH